MEVFQPLVDAIAFAIKLGVTSCCGLTIAVGAVLLFLLWRDGKESRQDEKNSEIRKH